MKTLKDGTEVSARVWYYLLDYLMYHDENHMIKLSNISRVEFVDLFNKAVEYDKGNLI